MLATAHTFALDGIGAEPVTVEVDVSRGLPAFSLVGLPDAAVRESRERVRAALSNSGGEFPLRRITANLAPADFRKAGPAFDLAIAAGLLAASGQLDGALLARYALAGELALDGGVRPVAGALAMAEAARREGMDGIVVAAPSAAQAALVSGLRVVGVERLEQLVALGRGEWDPPPPASLELEDSGPGPPDLADLRGQPGLRRALEVAAAGGHHLLISGPPGAGKSLAARRLPSLLPPLSEVERLEVMRVASAGGNHVAAARRPFRAPHHTISPAALVGGGTPVRAGEVTLAHRGVLFLDELPEFSRVALEALRQPLEEGVVGIVRVRQRVELPCRFQLIAAANPCPCGWGEDDERCTCPPHAADRYMARVSAALRSRIDLHIAVDQPPAEALGGEPGEPSIAVAERVSAARRLQAERLGEGRVNGEMSTAEVRRGVRLAPQARRLLSDSHRRLGLSGRSHDRVLRVARTVADLDSSDHVRREHVAEAVRLHRREGDR